MSSSLQIHACGDISEKLYYVASRIFHDIFKVKYLTSVTKGVLSFSYTDEHESGFFFFLYVGVVRITVQ